MGIRVSAAFPSNYLKAADLQGRHVAVVISNVVMEDVGDDNKPVVYFRGTQKGVVLNKTNANNIAVLYGDDTDAWIGQTVTLFPAMVDFQGRSVEAIRIRGPMTPQQPVAKSPVPPQGAPVANDPFGDGMAPGTTTSTAPPF